MITLKLSLHLVFYDYRRGEENVAIYLHRVNVYQILMFRQREAAAGRIRKMLFFSADDRMPLSLGCLFLAWCLASRLPSHYVV